MVWYDLLSRGSQRQAALQALLDNMKGHLGRDFLAERTGLKEVEVILSLMLFSLTTFRTIWWSSLITPSRFPPRGDRVLQTLGHGELLLEAKQAAGKTPQPRQLCTGTTRQGLDMETQPPMTLHPTPGTTQHHIMAGKMILGKWK